MRTQGHYLRVERLWERAALGLKCRYRWCRRRGMLNMYVAAREDGIAASLVLQCQRYYNLLQYLKGEGLDS